MRRPVVGMAVALAAGALAGDAPGMEPLWALGAGVLAGVAALGLVWRRAPAAWAFAAVLAAIACGGAAWAGYRHPAHSQRELRAALPMDERGLVRLRGWIASSPERRVRASYRSGDPPRVTGGFVLAVTELLDGENWRSLRGRLWISVGGDCGDLQYGDIVEGTVSVHRGMLPGNKGEPDLPRRLRRSGVAAPAWAPAASALTPSGERRGVPGLRALYAFKRRCAESVDNALPPDRAAIVKCLILGEAHALSEEQFRRFRETGTLHFLAISGQHVSMIAFFCWGVLAGFGLGRRATAGAVLGVVLFYSVLTGFAPSVARAAVMCACYCGAFFLARRPTLMSSMAVALIVILLIQPGDIFNIGLQLSFVAVAGMALLTEPIERMLFRRRDELDRLQDPAERGWTQHAARWYLQRIFSVSLAAWLATMPLMAWHFAMITPLAPVAGVALLPVVTLAMAAGLPGALLGGLLPGAAHALLIGAGWMAWLLDHGAECFALTGVARWYVPPPGGAVVALAYALAGAAVLWPWLKRTGWRLAAVGLAVAAAYFLFTWYAPPPAHTRVTMFSLGRGNSVLLQFPDGRNLLFDAGSLQPDYAERVLAPALWAQGVRRVNLAILSHADADHTNGLAELARRMPVGQVAIPAHFERQPGASALLAELAALNLRPVRVAAGDRLEGFPAARIEALWPPQDVPLDKMKDNELSLVLRVTTTGGRVLLTGDFGQRAVEPLLRTGADLRAEVLQVPHHGLPDFAARRFAEAVRPRLALVPGGAGMPAPFPYAEFSGRVMATDQYGMMSVELKPGPLTVETFRAGRVGGE